MDDPTTIIADFKQTAVNAKKAGFDGVERSYISFVYHSLDDEAKTGCRS